MRLPPGETEARSWQAVDDLGLTRRLRGLLPADRPALVLVDGRSGAGKTTFAGRLERLLDAAPVHTDDLSWQHHPTDWASLLVDGIVSPWRRGTAVSFRPAAWVAHDRPGSIDLPAGRTLVVEGVGAGRAELAALADLVVWVQSDRDLARRRGIDRDIDYGRTPEEAEAFWDEWMGSEEPFLAADRPWTRATLVVNGTAGQPDRTLLSAGPLTADGRV